MFSSKFCEISMNTFFTEQLRTTASIFTENSSNVYLTSDPHQWSKLKYEYCKSLYCYLTFLRPKFLSNKVVTFLVNKSIFCLYPEVFFRMHYFGWKSSSVFSFFVINFSQKKDDLSLKEGMSRYLDIYIPTFWYHKMVKHTQTICRQITDELLECVWSFCGVGA